MINGQLCIGTSGWDYPSWKDSFYAGVPRKNWLRFAASRFTAIEINATFYRLQQRSTFQRWYHETPAGFRFAIKGNRYLTHNRKLEDALAAVRRERERAMGLHGKLAAVIWQLPESFQKNFARLQRFAHALDHWRSTRHAIEFRHASWFDDEVASCLQRHRIAVCQSDAADWPLWPEVTTDLVYVRLHGHSETYVSGYSSRALAGWAEKLRRWRCEGRAVHVYFDNDALGHAPRNALQLMELAGAGTGPGIARG